TALSNMGFSHGIFLGISKGITMTMIQKTTITATLAIAIGTSLFEARRASKAHSELAVALGRNTPVGDIIELQELRQSLSAATNNLDLLRKENEELRQQPSEILRLRGEIGLLRKAS